jgi:hypothetical protein
VVIAIPHLRVPGSIPITGTARLGTPVLNVRP